jgi:hypothetical protein
MPFQTLSIPEILKKVSKADSREEKIKILRENNSLGVKQILHYAFFDSGKWYREDLPPFTLDEAPEGLSVANLFNEVRRLYLFKESYNLPKEKKDILLIQMLEALGRDETALIKDLFSKNFTKRYALNKKLVQEAFPEMANSVIAS